MLIPANITLNVDCKRHLLLFGIFSIAYLKAECVASVASYNLDFLCDNNGLVWVFQPYEEVSWREPFRLGDTALIPVRYVAVFSGLKNVGRLVSNDDE